MLDVSLNVVRVSDIGSLELPSSGTWVRQEPNHILLRSHDVQTPLRGRLLEGRPIADSPAFRIRYLSRNDRHDPANSFHTLSRNVVLRDPSAVLRRRLEERVVKGIIEHLEGQS